MKVQQFQMTVGDFCSGMEEGAITVNKAYQRSDKVWPPAARAFLIESILLDFPIPKLSLRQVTDVKSRRQTKEIVDGQQRSRAFLDYRSDKFAITRPGAPERFRQRKFSQLDDDDQSAFLEYALPIDLFVGASDEEIREVFRRINSYTMPLNPEEKRHAEFQGPFKWFIHAVTSRYSQTMVTLGVFGERQLSRMNDAKLFSEVTHAVVYGIQTTKGPQLNALYRRFDVEFAREAEIEDRFRRAFDLIVSLDTVPESDLVKPHQFYSLLLAAIHALSPVAVLQQHYDRPAPVGIDVAQANANLAILGEALASEADEFRAFVSAGAQKTNVAAQRVTRFQWYCRALDPRPLDAART